MIMESQEPLYLQNEQALYFYLRKFLKSKPDAVQLDGSKKEKPSKNVVVVFKFSVNDTKYKLFGDLTRKAAQHFIELCDEHGSPALALKECTGRGEGAESLIPSDWSTPNGWHCAVWVDKASDSLKKTG